MYRFSLKTKKWTLLYFDNMHERAAPFSTLNYFKGNIYRIGGRTVREKVRQIS